MVKARKPTVFCLDCGKPLSTRSHKVQRCFPCFLKIAKGDKACHWRGGRYETAQGYVWVYIDESNPYFPMAAKNRHHIQEHRLIMAQHLGRCLLPSEVVHHKNGIRNDNRLGNLELLESHGKHNSLGYSDGYNQGFADCLAIFVKASPERGLVNVSQGQ